MWIKAVLLVLICQKQHEKRLLFDKLIEQQQRKRANNMHPYHQNHSTPPRLSLLFRRNLTEVEEGSVEPDEVDNAIQLGRYRWGREGEMYSCHSNGF